MRLILCIPVILKYTIIGVSSHEVAVASKFAGNYDYYDRVKYIPLQDQKGIDIARGVREELVYDDFPDSLNLQIWVITMIPIVFTLIASYIYQNSPDGAGALTLFSFIFINVNIVVCWLCVFDKYLISKGGIGLKIFLRALSNEIKITFKSLCCLCFHEPLPKEVDPSFPTRLSKLLRRIRGGQGLSGNYTFGNFFNGWRLIFWSIFIVKSLLFSFLTFILFFAKQGTAGLVFAILTLITYITCMHSYPTFTNHYLALITISFGDGREDNKIQAILSLDDAVKLKDYIKVKKDDLTSFTRKDLGGTTHQFIDPKIIKKNE